MDSKMKPGKIVVICSESKTLGTLRKYLQSKGIERNTNMLTRRITSTDYFTNTFYINRNLEFEKEPESEAITKKKAYHEKYQFKSDGSLKNRGAFPTKRRK